MCYTLIVCIYQFTNVEGFERVISYFLHMCLGLPHSFSSMALYRNRKKLLLPFSSLSGEFMVTEVREVFLLRDSWEDWENWEEV